MRRGASARQRRRRAMIPLRIRASPYRARRTGAAITCGSMRSSSGSRAPRGCTIGRAGRARSSRMAAASRAGAGARRGCSPSVCSAGSMAIDESLELLTATGLAIAAGARMLVQNLSLGVRRGEFLAILGRNGSGKTLTLHALAGLSAPYSGQVLLDGEELTAMPRRWIAQRLGLLLQDREESLALSALESALIGRHPHLKFWQREGEQDLAIAQAALRRVGLADFARRSVATLSGGEQRRAAMASLLTQQPQIYLLDEPTNHLDPHHQT